MSSCFTDQTPISPKDSAPCFHTDCLKCNLETKCNLDKKMTVPVYVCDLRAFTKLKEVYVRLKLRPISDTRVKRLYFLEWREVPEL